MPTEAWDAAVLEHARIEILDDLHRSETLWRGATGRCACTVFQTYDWLAAWQDHLAAPGQPTCAIVHVAGADGTTLLLLPLGVFRRFGSRLLEFLGGDLCDYNAPVIDRDLAQRMTRRDVERLWKILLTRLPTFDLVNFRRMPQDIDGVPNPLITLNCEPGGFSYAARLPENFESFVELRSKSFFSQNRRHRRRLEKQGTIAFTFSETPTEQLAILQFTVERKALWQQKLGLPCTFGRPEHQRFYEHLTQARLSDAEVVVAGLRVDEVIVAGLWGVVFRGRFLFLVTSYHADWASFRVGRLMMEAVIRFCIERKLGFFDLTTGDEPYKANWADTTTPVFDYMSATTLLGVLVLRARAAKRRLEGFSKSKVLQSA